MVIICIIGIYCSYNSTVDTYYTRLVGSRYPNYVAPTATIGGNCYKVGAPGAYRQGLFVDMVAACVSAVQHSSDSVAWEEGEWLVVRCYLHTCKLIRSRS